MADKIYGEMHEIESDFIQLQNLITILKDAVQNNDNSYYLQDYLEYVCERMEKYAAALEEYNLKVAKLII